MGRVWFIKHHLNDCFVKCKFDVVVINSYFTVLFLVEY